MGLEISKCWKVEVDFAPKYDDRAIHVSCIFFLQKQSCSYYCKSDMTMSYLSYCCADSYGVLVNVPGRGC